jgi:2-polyprenyl-3-methyl-5-hydroxy-6-metoxy-1,4-benzoquinol methylase
MRFVYPVAQFPNNKRHLVDLNEAANRLYKKIGVLDIASLPISEYNKHYLGTYQKDLLRVLQRTLYFLAWSIANDSKPFSDFVFVDYGGGTGFLALLAKELGIGNVIYNDIYEVSCQDAQVIANSLELPADSYLCGGIDDLLNFFQQEQIFCDVVASYDVLEHIYNVESFLCKLSLSTHGPTVICMVSAANPKNPIISKHLIQMHLRYEYQDRSKEPGHKERDTLQAFYSIRKEIIQNYATELGEQEIEILARNTRGKKKEDILVCVDEYKRTKLFPPRPSHPTNTCDPYTGNWQEQLLELGWLKGVLRKQGMTARIINGYYGKSPQHGKNLLGLGLNLFILGSGKLGLRAAPYFILYGTRNACMQGKR